MQYLFSKNKNNIKEFLAGIADVLIRILIVLLGMFFAIWLIGIIPFAVHYIFTKLAIENIAFNLMFWVITGLLTIIPQIYLTIYGLFCFIIGIKIAAEL
jgi:hypothetical protein